MKPNSKPLEDVIVLDLTRFMAGPYATQLLADAGAHVIKIEPPGGEETRNLFPMMEDGDGSPLSGYFLRLNRRKQSICLDLNDPGDAAKLEKLVEAADVLVENFRPGVMQRFGLGGESLLAINPRLVYCGISGFGRDDSPCRDWPAFNLVAEAMAGVLSQSPTQELPPRPIGPALGDLFPAMHAAAGILLALHRRHLTGQGGIVDVAMYDSMLSFNELALSMTSMTGKEVLYGRRVNPNLAPYGYFPVRDGWVCIAIGPQRHWSILCEMMGRPDLGQDARLATGQGRSRHFAELIEPVLLDWLSVFGKEDIAAKLAAAGVPAAPVRNAAEVLHCKQAQSRGMFVDVSSPTGMRSVRVPGNPIRFKPDFDLGPARTVSCGSIDLPQSGDLDRLSTADLRELLMASTS